MSARKKNRFHPLHAIIAVVLLCIFVYGIFDPFAPAYPSRIGVAIIGTEDVVVFSYDPNGNESALVKIPKDTVVDAVHGYGTYSLSALFQLDSIEKRHGALFLETLEETLGFPIRNYVVSASDTTRVIKEPLSYLQSVFSIAEMLICQINRRKTNIQFSLFLSLYRGIRTLDEKDSVQFDMKTMGALVETTMADDSRVKRIDTKKLTLSLATSLTDSRIRQESLRVQVFNTTDMSGLAETAARLLETIGVHVVSLGNDDTEAGSPCHLKGKKEFKDSITAQTIRWIYHCGFVETNEDMKGDISLYIGDDLKMRFLPYVKK